MSLRGPLSGLRLALGHPPKHLPPLAFRFVAMNLETTEEELMHTVFPHPTLSEMMHESVLDAYGRVIHA